jgi:ADP-ribose pyrophosphatase
VAAPHGVPGGGPADEDLVERVVGSRVLHRGRYLEFRVDTIERADGSRSERDIAGHPGAVAIVAIDPDDRILLVRQWRTPAARVLLEIPAGTLDVDEATGATEDPDVAARRELEEETGYRAAGWQRLASFWTAPGFASEVMHLYLATDLTAAHPDQRLGPDEDEHLKLERRSLADALAAVDRGEIADAKSIVGLLWVARRQSARVELGRASDPSEPLTVPLRTYRPTAMEYVQASTNLFRKSRASLVFAALFAAAAVIADASSDPFAVVMWSVLAVAFGSGLFAIPFSLLTAWRYRDRVLQDVAVGVGPAGFVYRTETYTGETRWGTFRRIRESGRFLFLEMGPQSLYIPVRVFDPHELKEIRRLSAAAGFGPDGKRRREG